MSGHDRPGVAGDNWQVQEMNAEVALIAARVRARFGLKLPDAVQVATAIVSQSAALVTHDRDFAGITEVAVKIGK
ncbi:type II toxin-antitoxin system VapC family toxin [Ectothiorhodosinus mongolicus]|uniref:type II toxin-antitoxin system VapC family toxin n=1 Tax=Ectothiorhodosinus mongolicus TaxID=233100 RepID=UPI0009763602|nr:PIN domain-containing protein [Ectothiorhodosinus mongolicus]